MQNAPPRYNSPVRRLRQLVFNSLTALSLLLCMTMITFWIRSATIGDYVRWSAPGMSESWPKSEAVRFCAAMEFACIHSA
jgi:hypothetical protein